jgi:tRNA(fMet)-specific endonuclease VapC
MITYALDTNIVSYFLKNDTVIVQRIKEEKNRKNKIVIPPIVYFEIENWLAKNNSKRKTESFKKMYSEQGIGILDKSIFDIAVEEKLKLQKKGFSIENDDLLIAAYCIKHKLTLVTNNTKHFVNIKSLKIINWAE